MRTERMKEKRMKEKAQRKKMNPKNGIAWVLTVMISITLILIGNRVVMQDAMMFSSEGGEVTKATVIKVLEKSSDTMELGSEMQYENTVVDFKCRLESGTQKGEVVKAQQNIDGMYAGSQYIANVEKGDKILLTHSDDLSGGYSEWQFSDFYRFDKIIILLMVFAAVMIIIGRWKGVNTLLSLAFTFSFVFLVFVPAVMAGYNAYLWSGLTCIFTIIMTLILINSVSRKTFATIIGCVAGTVIAAVGTFFMSEIMELTGFVDEHSYYLTILDTKTPIDLTAIIFAAIIIGAMGAIMDVAMDISSSLYEISEQVSDMSFRKLYVSGMNIGRGIMGTMANTLVLAYIGSSLTTIMILLTFSTSPLDLMNREVIITELLQAGIGSLAILLTVPCTVAVCGLLYLKGKKR